MISYAPIIPYLHGDEYGICFNLQVNGTMWHNRLDKKKISNLWLLIFFNLWARVDEIELREFWLNKGVENCLPAVRTVNALCSKNSWYYLKFVQTCHGFILLQINFCTEFVVIILALLLFVHIVYIVNIVTNKRCEVRAREIIGFGIYKQKWNRAYVKSSYGWLNCLYKRLVIIAV